MGQQNTFFKISLCIIQIVCCFVQVDAIIEHLREHILEKFVSWGHRDYVRQLKDFVISYKGIEIFGHNAFMSHPILILAQPSLFLSLPPLLSNPHPHPQI